MKIPPAGINAAPWNRRHAPLSLPSLMLLLTVLAPAICSGKKIDLEEEIEPLTVVGIISAVGSLFSFYKLRSARLAQERDHKIVRNIIEDIQKAAVNECRVFSQVDCTLKEQRDRLADLQTTDPHGHVMDKFCNSSSVWRKGLEKFVKIELKQLCHEFRNESLVSCTTLAESNVVEYVCDQAPTRNVLARRERIWRLDVLRLRMDTLLASQCDAIVTDFKRQCDGILPRPSMLYAGLASEGSALSDLGADASLVTQNVDLVLGIAFAAIAYTSSGYDVYDTISTNSPPYPALAEMAQRQVEMRRKSMCGHLEHLLMTRTVATAWTSAVLRHSQGKHPEVRNVPNDWGLDENTWWVCDKAQQCFVQYGVDQPKEESSVNPFISNCMTDHDVHGNDRVKICGAEEYLADRPWYTAYLPKACFQQETVTVSSMYGKYKQTLKFDPQPQDCESPLEEYKKYMAEFGRLAEEFRSVCYDP